MELLKTSVVAEQLGIGYHRLFGLIRSRKLTPPGKDSSGDYVWSPEDVARARSLLTSRETCQEAVQAASEDCAPDPATAGPTPR